MNGCTKHSTTTAAGGNHWLWSGCFGSGLQGRASVRGDYDRVTIGQGRTVDALLLTWTQGFSVWHASGE
jgi:hypothetical protein